MRILLYTGKGGVGKTSVAAATAVKCAELGYRTVVLSTDAAHSLADCFDLELGPAPRRIAENLFGQEVDVLWEIERYWGAIQDYMSALMTWRGLDDVIAEEMAVLPGMEEVASLLYIVTYHDNEKWDVVIVDCAPTGETLRLLAFPEMMRWWMNRLFPVGRKAAQVLTPLAQSLLRMPLPEDRVYDELEKLFQRLDRMQMLLTQPDLSSIRLVLNPEKMVVKEAQRTYTYLNLYGYPTDAIICNRLIPEKVHDEYFDAWRETQERYYKMVEDNFAPLPVLRVPLFEQEVVGMKMLREMAEAIFNGDDPARIYYRGKPQEVSKEDGYYVLRLALPFVSRKAVDLTHVGDELIVHIGNRKRNIVLPRALVGLETTGAHFEGDILAIRFQEPHIQGHRA